MTGVGQWAIAFTKAQAAVANLTLAEKVVLLSYLRDYSGTNLYLQVSLTAGVDRKSNDCNGNIPAIDSIDFPGLCLNDAGQGVRNTDFVSSFPSGIHVAAR